MKNKLLLVLLLFVLLQTGYSQNNAVAVRSIILNNLNLEGIRYFGNVEAVINIANNNISVIHMEVHLVDNKFNPDLKDFYYELYFDDYKIMLYKSALSEKYYINEIEITIKQNPFIFSLLPYQRIEQFKLDKNFGNLDNNFSNETELVYEIVAGWDMIYMFFDNGNITRIVIQYVVE
jgi:hypothetical protein